MRQNKNQHQNSDDRNRPILQEIQQATLSQKVLELEVQLHNSQKHYQCVKKPIKFFSKFKRNLNESKSTEKKSEVGFLSQKIIPPNIVQNLQSTQKSPKAHNIRLKNVYDAYKQALEHKYRKRMKQYDRSVLKINVSKIEQNQSVGHQLIYERQDEIKKRLSNKKIDPSIISNLQPLSTSNRQQTIMKTFNPKKNTSFLLETVDDTDQNILNSFQKKNSGKKYPAQYYDYLLSPNHQTNFYQIKRKCYTEDCQPEDEQNKDRKYNKTRNISFRLPSEKIKSHKHFIQKIGGITYNLPQILDKMNRPDSNATISYLVKSLRKPSKSENQKCQRQKNSPLQDYRKASQNHTKHKKIVNQKYYTLSIQSSEQFLNLDTNENDYFQNIIGVPSNRHKSNKNSLKYESMKNKNKKGKTKLNAINDIKGWYVENQLHQTDENSFFTTNRFEKNKIQNSQPLQH